MALFFVGLGIRGERGYALEDVGGMNLLRRYEVGIGKAYAMEEALALAGGLRQLEEWVFAQLQSLVPAAYRGPTAQPEGAV